MMDWTADRTEITDLIRRAKATFKLITKVKNDALMLRRWVAYHEKIVGPENLVVFDNNSDDKETVELLASLDPRVLVISFKRFHNLLHRVNEVPELYEALQTSSRYYQFLDVDEYVGYIDDELAVHRERDVVGFLDAQTAPVIPGVWIENVFGFDDRFHFNHRDGRLRLDVRTGKPVISSDTAVFGMINHNFQVPEQLYGSIRTNVVVFHLLRLSAEQRVKANLAKLIAYNALPKGASVEDALAIDPETLTDAKRNPRTWLREIHKMVSIEPPKQDQPLNSGDIEIASSGLIRFSEEWQADALRSLIRQPGTARDRVFGSHS